MTRMMTIMMKIMIVIMKIAIVIITIAIVIMIRTTMRIILRRQKIKRSNQFERKVQ